MADCLRKKPAEELIEAHKRFYDWLPVNPAREPMNVFSPRPDPEAEEPFLPQHPIVPMEEGRFSDVPFMMSSALKEGNWRINYVAPDNPTGERIWKDFVAKADKLLPLALGIFGSNSKDEKALMKKLADYYDLNSLGQRISTKFYTVVLLHF